MNQFKSIFLGQIDPNAPGAKWTRAVNSQKCIRAGGKHNDLDDVGKDTYHHTFFEMLGNWSFGNYFKEEAVDWAWDILVNSYGLDPKRLYATYFGGDVADGLDADDAAKNLWLKYLPESHVLPFGRKENFWEMGDTGPCGPCSELHYDRLSDRENAGELVNADSPDLIEIWNLVFMQFNREKSGKLTTLPAQHIDTGMGFERLTSILQDKPSNYDTDVFSPIFEKIREVTGAAPYGGLVGKDDVTGIDTAYRIVADHIRTLTFALTDGAVPSSGGRGYVLRRILRRAVRYGKDFLSAKDGFFHNLVDVVVEKFGGFFPELHANKNNVKEIIAREEAHFNVSLQRGTNKFESLTRKMQRGDVLSGKHTFLLFGTFGFPLDLIQIMCDEKGFKIDLAGFEEERQKQKRIAKGAYESKKKGGNFVLQAQALSDLQTKGIAPTVDSYKYGTELPVAIVQAIWKGDPENGSFVEEVVEGDECCIILDSTSFYAESGGQIFDCGSLEFSEATFDVQSVKVFAGYVTHLGSVVSGKVNVGAQAQIHVDLTRRQAVMANHTSTHLTNHALRKVLTTPTDQKGSIVIDSKFRFDFSCPQALTRVQVIEVEKHVNNVIDSQIPVYVREVTLADAYKIKGVRAMFAETYPDPVRVVSVGVPVEDLLANPENESWLDFSVEFCGGTHLSNSRDAEKFVIISEEAISLGERRIVAVTGQAATEALEAAFRLEEQVRVITSTETLNEELLQQLRKLQEELGKSTIPYHIKLELREILANFEEKIKAVLKKYLADTKVGGGSFLQNVLSAVDADPALHVVAEVLPMGGNTRLLNDTAAEVVATVKKEKGRDIALFLLSVDEKKGVVVVASVVPESLIAKGLKANEWIKTVAGALGGTGGGHPKGGVAQGNFPSVDSIPSAIEQAKQYSSKFLE